MTGNIQTLMTESVMPAKAGRNILEVMQKQGIMVSLVAVIDSIRFFLFFVDGVSSAQVLCGYGENLKCISLASWQAKGCGKEMWTNVVTKLTSFSILRGLCQQEVRREDGEPWMMGKGNCRTEGRKLGQWQERRDKGVTSYRTGRRWGGVHVKQKRLGCRKMEGVQVNKG